MDAFIDDEGGYTSVAVAVALLVSLTLVFAAAAASWTTTRSADVQVVADATAMAGANVVAAYMTIAQVLDACVLSMGLAGMVVYAVGMVVAAVPILQSASPHIIDVGRNILDARRRFARASASGLERLGRALPALVMANSASCVSANCTDGIEYVGCAVAVPSSCEVDYSYLDDGLTHDELDADAERLRGASAQKEDALLRAAEAKERAWRADCVDDPLCMRSRAHTLAGLSGAHNPNYPLASEWRFGYAVVRARNYYLARTRIEMPQDASVREMSRSAARKAFYRYAYGVLGYATCIEEANRVVLSLPDLPHTKDTVRATTLYGDALWPCTSEPGGVTLHASLDCPGALGAPAGTSSLAALEAGRVRECPSCHMSLSTMGSVASASTNIDNGFEHYWRIVVTESRAYQEALRVAEEMDQAMGELSREGASAFQHAIDSLRIARPAVRLPGMWGCVSLVVRKSGSAVPSELTSAFLTASELPPGAAMAAAALAPDTQSPTNVNALASMLDGVRARDSLAVDVIGDVTELWGRLLVGYGAGVEHVASVSDDALAGVGALFGERVALWLKGRLAEVMGSMSLSPVDLRLRKPVLVSSQAVLERMGSDPLAQARQLLTRLPNSSRELTSACWLEVAGQLGGGRVTLAELPIPGTSSTIPLTIDLSRLVDAL